MDTFPITEALYSLARAFSGAGHALYAVGGAVRNPLLQLPVSDTDICSSMRPDDVQALCSREGFSCFPKGAAFGTLDIVSPCGERYEYACFRSEQYATGGAHRPKSVQYSDSLAEDAFRRDFTVNAVYLDILNNTLLDPTGGLSDIDKRIIRATSPDPRIIMGDDALRILRMARFASQLGFTIEDGTLLAARERADGLADISPERIADELTKLLLSDARYGAGRESLFYGLEALHRCGAYTVILPELAACEGVLQRREYHAHDVLFHTLHAVASCPPEPALRMTMLFHDIGKPAAVEDHGNMHGHEELGASMADDIMRRLRYPNKLRETVCTLVRWHMFDLDGRAKEATLRKRFVMLGRENALLLCDVREADVHGSGIIEGPVATAVRWRHTLEAMQREHAPFSENELDCTGLDIATWLNIAPGAEIGRIKRALLLHCAARPRDNRRAKLRMLALDIQRRPVK